VCHLRPQAGDRYCEHALAERHRLLSVIENDTEFEILAAGRGQLSKPLEIADSDSCCRFNLNTNYISTLTFHDDVYFVLILISVVVEPAGLGHARRRCRSLRRIISGYPPVNTAFTRSSPIKVSVVLATLPAIAFCKNVGLFSLISARESGKRFTTCIRPARLSETWGRVSTLAEPVRRKRPGRRSTSMVFLMARSRSGARCTSSTMA